MATAISTWWSWLTSKREISDGFESILVEMFWRKVDDPLEFTRKRNIWFHFESNTISIYIGVGSTSYFASEPDLSTGSNSYPERLASSDLNKDGHLHIAVVIIRLLMKLVFS